jgi:murein DD-endopeptidase MepM/ murein hydrolase activator NlpD
VSGPTSVAPVLARIGQIQAAMGATVSASGPATADGSFAAALTGASAGGPVTAAQLPSTWSIPWADGAAPSSVAGGRDHELPATIASRAVLGSSSTTASSGGQVTWPLKGAITQRFGPTTCTLEPPATVNGHHYAHYHDGLDIGAAKGSPVRSMAAGTVEYAGRYPDGAVVVRVRHADGSVALYAHLEPGLDVRKGDSVAAGQILGRVGMTGHTTGPHLHLELAVNGNNVDPLPVLRSGRLPGAPATAAPAATGWTAASPLAASDAKLTPAALDRFDAVASTIPYHAAIRDAAVRAGIDPLFLASLVRAESGFRADAVSSAGALGLCQLMPANAKSMGVKDPFDPLQNLRAGARYIAHNLQLYGRSDLALAAYHDGKGAVAAAGGVPDHQVTHAYIDRILSYWTHYREAAA